MREEVECWRLLKYSVIINCYLRHVHSHWLSIPEESIFVSLSMCDSCFWLCYKLLFARRLSTFKIKFSHSTDSKFQIQHTNRVESCRVELRRSKLNAKINLYECIESYVLFYLFPLSCDFPQLCHENAQTEINLRRVLLQLLKKILNIVLVQWNGNTTATTMNGCTIEWMKKKQQQQLRCSIHQTNDWNLSMDCMHERHRISRIAFSINCFIDYRLIYVDYFVDSLYFYLFSNVLNSFHIEFGRTNCLFPLRYSVYNTLLWPDRISLRIDVINTV